MVCKFFIQKLRGLLFEAEMAMETEILNVDYEYHSAIISHYNSSFSNGIFS